MIQLGSLPSYSQELGLDLSRDDDRFRWLLASVLFARRISSGIAKRTFRLFVQDGLDSAKAIRDTEWERIVDALDRGGYVRYDFSTATNLQILSGQILSDYGSLEALHERAGGPRDLERRLDRLRGVGPTAVKIFLRELRGIWPKADPEPSEIAKRLAAALGIEDVKRHETQLVRLYLEYCKKGRCDVCEARAMCRARPMKRLGWPNERK
jgi:endonuclease III